MSFSFERQYLTISIHDYVYELKGLTLRREGVQVTSGTFVR